MRGIAVMGILTMNIAGFAMVFPAYFNPLAGGDGGLADRLVYSLDFILFDGRMRGLFSFLFGASMLVVIDGAARRGADAARLHLARMAALLAFGLAHLWFFWWGDILAHYALVGTAALLFAGASPRMLIGTGAVLVAWQCWTNGAMAMQVLSLEAMLADPAQAPAAARTLAGFRQSFGVPDPAWIAQQTALARGPWTGMAADRVARHGFSWWRDLFYLGPETLAYMLFGMAAQRTGLLAGAWPRARYRRWALVGLGATLPLYAILALWLWGRDFDMAAVLIAVIALPTPIRPIAIVGTACLVLWLVRPGGPGTERIAAVGRAAFSNYLATTLVCTTLFYGHGLGWFGRFDRLELWGVVLAVWALMLGWSRPWLARYRHGPMEWLWRSVSQGRLVAMRR